MGAVAPAPGFSASAQADFVQAILQPTLKGLEQEGLDYRGFIFFGLMIQEDRCYLLEYNARLGDPETQGVLPLADFDFIDVCTRILDGGLGDFRLSWKSGAVCAPVAVASGYPGEYRVGDRIAFKAGAENRHIFFAGAERTSDGLYTSGGRVFSAAAWGPDLGTAREWAYRTFESVHFPGMEYRKDIGLP
jgi:phosphoribosylamine--glycine ligase